MLMDKMMDLQRMFLDERDRIYSKTENEIQKVKLEYEDRQRIQDERMNKQYDEQMKVIQAHSLKVVREKKVLVDSGAGAHAIRKDTKSILDAQEYASQLLEREQKLKQDEQAFYRQQEALRTVDSTPPRLAAYVDAPYSNSYQYSNKLPSRSTPNSYAHEQHNAGHSRQSHQRGSPLYGNESHMPSLQRNNGHMDAFATVQTIAVAMVDELAYVWRRKKVDKGTVCSDTSSFVHLQ